MGIEMGMGIKSSRVGRNGNFVFREIPAPSDSYNIYSNLQIECTITVALPGYTLSDFGTVCMPSSKSQRACYFRLY